MTDRRDGRPGRFCLRSRSGDRSGAFRLPLPYYHMALVTPVFIQLRQNIWFDLLDVCPHMHEEGMV